MTIAATVHPAYPEAAAIFAERLALYPAGCLIMETHGGPAGYAISHPWLAGAPPKLDTRLERLPAHADLFYIHDIALMPAARGLGMGLAVVDRLAVLAAAAGLHAMALVAVSVSAPFWRRSGFEPVDDPAIGVALASYGGSALFMVRRLSPS